MSSMSNVYDKNGMQNKLGNLLAKGGEGEVFPLIAQPKILVKRYFKEQTKQDKKALENKVGVMSALRPKFKDLNMSWVAISVFDDKKQWIGYAMPKIEGKTMRSLAHALLYKKHAPNLNRRDVAVMMYDWLKSIQKLHSMDIMIGDYNLGNFMWDPNTYEVGFIDCDSYQIKHQGKIFRCTVGSPDLTAPEHHGKSFKNVVRTEESELFSIAIVLFMCFMLGRHPYDIVGGEDPVKNLQQGNFAYGTGNNGFENIPKGDWYKIWSHMTFAMKNLFITTFTEGANNPSKRATIDEWLNVLYRYIAEMDKGYHSVEMRPSHIKEVNFRGSSAKSC